MLAEKRSWRDDRVATGDGHANLRTWCWLEEFEHSLVTECLVNRDLKKSAHLVFDQQVARGAGELDASYCFMEGHCLDTELNENSTIQDAEKQCDRKYGHAGWAEVSRNSFLLDGVSSILTGGASASTGFHTKSLAESFGKLACAMGNWHCDNVYCKETYCKHPHYRERYSYLSHSEPRSLSVIDRLNDLNIALHKKRTTGKVFR